MEVANKKETLRDIQMKHEVSLSYFLRFSDTTKDMFDEVLRRILLALGVDTTSKDGRINFEAFVRIKCLLTFNSLERSELVKIWNRILNPLSQT